MATPWSPPPQGVRVLYCEDRVVIDDVSRFLEGPPPDRNTLIDEVNRAAESNGDCRSSCTSLLFDSNDASPSFKLAERTGLTQGIRVLGMDVAMGVLGTVELNSGSSLVLVHSAKIAGELPSGPVYQVTRISLAPLYRGEPSQTDRSLGGEIVKMLESGYVFYSQDTDISKSIQSRSQADSHDLDEEFWWTRALAGSFIGAGAAAAAKVLRTIYGFMGSCPMSALNGKLSFRFALVSRRSRKRAGTRYITRGADFQGNVANFVETEQVVWARGHENLASFRVMRGSIPVLWRQNNGLAKPPPEIVPPVSASQIAFKSHFTRLQRRFGKVVAVSLVNHQGPEKVLADAFERHAQLDWDHSKPEQTNLISFDYHAECHGAEHDNGLLRLTGLLRDGIHQHRVFVGSNDQKPSPLVMQTGVFRVNCVDCLDRTNVVQSIIARGALNLQMYAVFRDILGTQFAGGKGIPLSSEAEGDFKRVWADNADAISKQYSGTGALKTDVTRTGQRSTTGMLGDGVKSVMRMYYKNVVDQGRQEAIEVLCGYATGSPLPPNKMDVEFSYHDAQRVGAGGDRDPCTLEVRSNSLMLSTAEGIRFDLPRDGIVAWEKRDGVKSRPRLRILYDPSMIGSNLIAASPLEFQFKAGGADREKFIRSIVHWSRPKCLELFHGDVRVRVASFRKSIPASRAERLFASCGPRDVLCIVLTNPGPDCRGFGLEAVPPGFEDHGVELLSCRRLEESSIAIFVSKTLKPATSNVEEAALSLEGRKGVCIAISTVVAGTSICFVAVSVSGAGDLVELLSSLRLGRAGFDVSSQFHHCYIVGQLAASAQARGWTELGDRSWVRTSANQIGCIRYSLPGQKWTNQLSSSAPEDLVDETLGTREFATTIKQPIRTSIAMTQLRVEKLRMPGSIPRDTPLLGYISFSSDYAVEMVATSTVPRIAHSPEWDDVVTLRLDSADKSEVWSSYVYGQIMITTPVVEDLLVGTFALPVAMLKQERSFSAPIRSGAFHGGVVSGLVSVTESLTTAESCMIGVSAEVQDLKSRVSNTRKAKNMIGKVSNFLSKKPGDQGPFRSFAEDEPAGSRGSGPLPAGRRSAYQSGDLSAPAARSGGSLIDFSEMSQTPPISSRKQRPSPDQSLLAAFGFGEKKSQATPRSTGEKESIADEDSWGDFQGSSAAKPQRENKTNNNFIDW